ncbi:rhodanese-like domain-containing protein [Desulfonema magnum]|uniref:Rhodanese-like domain-containing protein n=1 Tax=Desulfonema magnum TaxID=45655 RepID=A0A975BRW5_9BACT|nr:rhodanese-like domain-containing protein [Desulfonema magnum]QTA90501.1 Rhodanese-like domain-containing protein [Desulfonema magnum]
MYYRHMMKELLCLVSLALITAFTVNFFSPKGIALMGDWDTSQGVITAKAKDDVVDHELEIDIIAAREIYLNDKSVFVDARTRELYEEGHIKNAVSLPLYEFEELFEEFMNNYPASLTIVTYCTGRECEDSHHLARYFSEMGYLNIKVYVDGYDEWKEGGYPIEKQ